MLEVKSIGMGHLETYLKELQEASAALHLNFTLPGFDAGSEESLQEAMARMETSVDERVAPWKHNQTVLGMAQEAKKRFREEMKARAQSGL